MNVRIVGVQPDRAQVDFLLDLLAKLEERCDGEPHCHACVFCGAMERGEHQPTCPWLTVLAIVK